MSRRILGLLLFAAALAALLAGYQIVAVVSAMTGLLFVASTARAGRAGTGRGGSGAGWYRRDDRRDDNDRFDGGDSGFGGDSGGGGDGGGGGD